MRTPWYFETPGWRGLGRVRFLGGWIAIARPVYQRVFWAADGGAVADARTMRARGCGMSAKEFYLFGHLIGVFILIGAAGLSTTVGVVSGRMSSAPVVVALLDLQHRAEWFATLPGAVIAVVFGSLLVDKAGYSMSDAWVGAAYVIVIVALVLDLGYLMRKNRAARAAAAELASASKGIDDNVRRMLTEPVVATAGVLLDVSFIVLLYLMVWKPGA
jgi:uncharacterized membrane protein